MTNSDITGLLKSELQAAGLAGEKAFQNGLISFEQIDEYRFQYISESISEIVRRIETDA